MAGQEPKPVGELDDGVWTKTVWIPQIDGEAARQVERLKRDLDLENVAALDGHKNFPAPSDTRLNTTQHKICDQVFHEILMLNEFLSQEVGLALKRVRPMIPPRLDVRRTREQMAAAIDDVFIDRHHELVSTKLKELEAMRNLRLFRFHNALSRSANEKLSNVKTFALILVVFLLESAINGSLLSEVVSGGLVEGGMFAAFISLINISTGLIAGFYGWRYLGHRKPALRFLIGLPIALAMHGAAIGWNLFVAHFREVAEAMAASASFNFNPALLAKATLEHFQIHGAFGVTSLQSLGLLLLGVIIHFLAAKEGWDDLSDRYPDYSRVQVAATEASERYEDALADTRDMAREAIESVEAGAQDIIGKTRRCCDGIAEMLELAAERRQEVRNSEDKCVAAGTQLLRTYREINTSIRDEGSAPAHFHTYPSAADYRNRTFDGAAASHEVREQEQLVEKTIGSLLEIRDRTREALAQAEDALTDVTRGVGTALRALDQRVEAESKKIKVEAEALLRAGDGMLAMQSTGTAPEEATA